MVVLRSRIELRKIRCLIIRAGNSAMGLDWLRSLALPDIAPTPRQKDSHPILVWTLQAVFKIVERNQAESRRLVQHTFFGPCKAGAQSQRDDKN